MDELKQALRLSFDDRHLSKDEKYEFRELLEAYRNDSDTLSFVRNRAFDIASEAMRSASLFDADTFRWLENVVKTIDGVRESDRSMHESEVFFSPGEECKRRIVSLLDGARSSAEVCVFTISDDDISEALYRAHRRRVAVRIITDNDKANDRGSDVERLLKKGMAIVKDQTANHMHHKFALIDQRFLINGSFNWTRSASKYNNENITVDSSPVLMKRFSSKFEEMWRAFGGAQTSQH